MSFNGLCTGNDIRYSYEGQRVLYDNLKLKAPKSSYKLINYEKSPNIRKIDYIPTKYTYFNKNNIPNWIELNFYSLPKKDGKKIIAVHIINNCLSSKYPNLIDPNLILYCHENETDLLRLAPFLIDLSVQMKCNIVSFDYWGFGCSSGKPKINTILTDAEDAMIFSISYLKYKIENIIIFGNGIGAMSSIYLSSRHNYQNCQSLILYMPIIGKKIIDVKAMRSIFSRTLLIMEFENKNDILDNEVIALCREIPNEKEWFPTRKRNTENNNSFFGKNTNYEDYNDVYFRHRQKFIVKLRDYLFSDRETKNKKKSKSSTVGGSTASETNSELQDNIISLGDNTKKEDSIEMNFDSKENININKNLEEIEEEKCNQIDEFDENEIHLDDEDY